MSDQLILPLFAEWGAVTARDGDLLAIANAGGEWYAPALGFWKKEHFYPLKTRLLRRYGVPDGCDLQIIELPCNRCFKGIWRSDCGVHSDVCHRCCGTGIYRTDAVQLRRWLFGGRLFHEPQGRERDLTDERIEELKEGQWRSVINGLVRHQTTAPREARRAWLWLLWRFERDRFYEAMETLIVSRFAVGLAELERRFWQRPYRAVESWLYDSNSRLAEGLREWFDIQPIPF